MEPSNPSNREPVDELGKLERSYERLLCAGAAADIFLCGTKLVKKVLRISPGHFNNTTAEQGEEILLQYRKDFNSRVLTWSRLAHPNIARLSSPSQEILSFHQEYCEQGDLRNVSMVDFMKHSARPPFICHSIVEGILSGLTYLHNYTPAIVHGNLNPGKIFVSSDGNVRIGEFGLAESMAKFSHLVPAVSFNGLVRWASPERLQREAEGHEEFTSVQCDVWSFGCTLLEIITGHYPYSKYKYDPKVMQRIMGGEPPDDLEQAALPSGRLGMETSCVDFLRELIRRCWVNPQDRASSKELLELHILSNHERNRLAPSGGVPSGTATPKAMQTSTGQHNATAPQTGVNIIIFEGGLSSGLSSLVVFKEVMARVYVAGGGSEAREQFTMMAGTGSGALIACMLGLLKMDIEWAISTYAGLVERVFSDKEATGTSGSGAFKPDRLEEELKKMVRDATGDEDALMISTPPNGGECKIMVFAMPEHNANASTPRIFRSYRVPNHHMLDCPIWKALRATTAHPELFKSIETGDISGIGESLVEGDLGCSNHTPQVLAEVSALFPGRHITSIVSIDSGHIRTINIPQPNPLHWVTPVNERVAEEMAVRFPDTAYFRFSVDQKIQDARTGRWQRTSEVVAHTRAYMQRVGVKTKIDEAAQSIVAQKKRLSTALVEGKVQQPREQLATGVRRCPAPSPVFTGCDHHLSQVSSCLSGAANERRVCVVHGLGGTGKTQIALKVVERTKNRWIDMVYVDATSRETTLSTLKNFAAARKIGDTHRDAIRWLESSQQPWLLIFDNADDPNLNLPEFIPEGSHGSVLITTRLRSLALLGQGPGSDCSVGRMDSEEAVELLLKVARMDGVLPIEEMESAKKLVENLGYLALAIVQAGAYIYGSLCSITHCMELCLKHTQATLERYSSLLGIIDGYDKTVYTTWSMSYERLKPRTQQLLGLMAYLHCDGITEDIFKRAAGNIRRALFIPPSDDEAATREYVRDYLELFLDTDGNWDSNAFLALMDELLLYSLVDYDRVNEAYTLHVLVQDWARTTISRPKTAALKHALHLLALSIDWSDDIMAHLFRRGVSLHVSGLLDNPNAVDANDAAYFARVYEENGRWSNVEVLQAQVLDTMKQTLGERHPDTLTSMNNLAMTYWRQGRWDEAETTQVQVLDIMKQTLGEHHPNTLTSINNLATTYSDQGRWSEAEALQMQVLETRWQRLGGHHPDTLASMNNLATTYSSQGQWITAEALQVQVLDAAKQTLGERHPDTLASMNNLALTYWAQDRWDAAETLQELVLAAWKQTLGERHPDTLTSMNNLALTYSSRGRWDEAEVVQVQVLDIIKQTLGEHHPDTLTSMNNLAVTYSRQGRWDSAEALQVQAVDGSEQTLGKQHPQTLTAMKGLAFTYRNQGRDRIKKLEALEEEIRELEKKS